MSEDRPTKPAHRLIIRPFSAVIYLYPTFIATIVCGLILQFWGATPESPGVTGIVFTLLFFFNLSIVAFDYTRLAAVIIVLILVILSMLSSMYAGVGEMLRNVLDQPLFMNATFYWVWAVGFACTFVFVMLKTRFDYWEIKNNELLHHHGFMGDVERWPAPNMRISKEIKDVMEYVLAGAGRLVLVPGGERRALVIDNVPRINRVEREMQELLNILRVADGD